ncbi:LysE/ArgO family amino acid transporter [Halomonas huangheensis]|nr:LysE family transporter [Halomonas huangheensis]ALM52304.1 lysine transporter LysE [Halomonas huangheensis]
MWMSVMQGMGTGGALIVAIGAQNAFVLDRGLRGEHAWHVAWVCALCDALLIGLGVLGLGALISRSELAMQLASYGGAAFLLWQAWLAVQRMRQPDGLKAEVSRRRPARGQVIVATLAVTLLNPQVYLDTLVMLGSIGSLQQDPLGFYLGATFASFCWFFALVGAAGFLAPRLASPRAWQVIDGVIAVIMVVVAVQLLRMELG